MTPNVLTSFDGTLRGGCPRVFETLDLLQRHLFGSRTELSNRSNAFGDMSHSMDILFLIEGDFRRAPDIVGPAIS
jgi:hypothetical protein